VTRTPECSSTQRKLGVSLTVRIHQSKAFHIFTEFFANDHDSNKFPKRFSLSITLSEDWCSTYHDHENRSRPHVLMSVLISNHFIQPK
jgi:hypothetical protein